jgi:adenine phosphoribosyltransferase
MDEIRRLVREVRDFPKPGILFRDITPVLENPAALKAVVDALARRYAGKGVSRIVGIESRGFIFGAPLAYALGCGFVPVRKPGKLPRPTFSASYDLEYGQDAVHIHQDAVARGERVVIVDDLIATGGTAKAAAELIGRCGGTVHEIAAIIELAALAGRAKLAPHPVHALLTY